MSNELRTLPLAKLTPSNTQAQIDRRKSFDQAALDELAGSIKAVGMLAPIVVRPDPQFGDCYQIVAGERRFIAAQRAELDEVPVSVRELTDEQVLEVQLIENLQREGLHPLHEAEGYEQLMKVHGHTADELADRIGKSRRYVYARIQLLKLCKEARQAFYEGKLTASTALLVARIPSALQKEAIEEIGGDGARLDPMSTRQAADFIQRNYMLSLADAPFPTITENLVKGTPACHRCPKNTNAQPELFEDVKASSAGICTDLTCFQKKQAAHIDDQVAKAKKSGQKVIEGEAAKKIFPYALSYAQGGYQLLNDVKDRLKKDAPIVLVRARDSYDDDREHLIEVVESKHVAEPKANRSSSGKAPAQTKQDVERDRSTKLRAALFRMIFDKTKVSLRQAAELLVADLLSYQLETDKIFDALGFDDWNLDQHVKELAKLKPEQLAKLMAVLPLADDLSPYGDADKIEAAAKELKINVAAVEKEVFPPEEKPAPAKASKKKAARKAK